ncbi:hypothetical protein OOK39_13670 [Streptomyces sp. NBC_00264]|uniref:hypothetical protein n=1 Tax=unclassified Streptomyces TaxID=2593676 RepID=UPI00225687A5|nr:MULTISPECIES: hypothetical protein [unclassified Streptomyces]WSX01552.1 hypothetical protein OG355_14560 [Streptomyces sp. NBC_00987]MCX4396554.1 hypothetical protein [Streptomyces sp. NBC_01767]MCX5100798.1 hypothetical protein [Streptomyces sp. NBC_00439]MCX5160319.1 hypothetical protein [Streptomyces sp. NBC_00305]MCX5218842.1 hypothetical protein [Streptomyces sp. NBC_00264]
MSGKRREAHGDGIRLLPWTGQEEKPCYVIGDGTGYVSRMADGIESVQLGMAGDLLGHAADLLADRKVTGAELHFLASRLAESLREVKRVAESRGSRLSATGSDPDGFGPQH